MTLDLLIQNGQIPSIAVEEYVLAAKAEGEALRPRPGVLRAAMGAQKQGKKGIFVHPTQAQEAAIVKELEVLPAAMISDLIHHLSGTTRITPVSRDTRTLFAQEQAKEPSEMADIIEDENAKHALEIAAIGNHPCVLFGHARSGKRRLAEHIVGIMPRLTLKEALVVTLRYSDEGELPLGSGLIAHRQIRHISAETSLEEVKTSLFLSHLGLLILHDPQEFDQEALVMIQKALQTQTTVYHGQEIPCRPQVIALCPSAKLPEPLVPFFDLYIEVPIITPEDHLRFDNLESSQEIRERVASARQWQQVRFEDQSHLQTNGDIPLVHAHDWVSLDKQALQLATISIRNLQLDTKILPQALRVAQSIADRVGEPKPLPYHLAEAIHYLHPPFKE